MRKISVIVLAFLMLLFTICVPSVFAGDEYNNNLSAENIISTTKEYYEDGSYDIIVLSEIINESDNSSPTRTTYSITGSRTVIHYDSSHNKLYGLKSTGTFFYDNSTVSCHGRSYQSYIYNSEWTVENITTSAGGAGTTKASATASGTAKRHYLGLTIQTASISSTVYCDKDGNLS